MSASDNPLAFPRSGTSWYDLQNGMTLRDWLAGQALAGAMSYSGSYDLNNGPGDMAARCYQIADAMLAARATGTDQ